MIIPTKNRPELLAKALRSVLVQCYADTEIIVVDDGDKVSAEGVVKGLSDPRIRYIVHEGAKGGSAARNRGIKEASGTYIAFLDDDDEWLPEKLAKQFVPFAQTPHDVGFSVTGVQNVSDAYEFVSEAPEGTMDMLPLLLTRFKAFLTSTLIVKRYVFDEIGMFDETLPSHQEADLLLRIAQVYKGFAYSGPLVRMNMQDTRGDHIGGNIARRIAGREMLLEKHKALYLHHAHLYAKLYFWLAIWCRDSGALGKAKQYFWTAFTLSWNPRYLAHYLLVFYKKDFVCQ